MTDGDWVIDGPDLEKIQCKDCKYALVFEWDGVNTRYPEANNCKKYPKKKNMTKPDGILYRIYDISKHERECDGYYINCKYYKKDKHIKV